MSQTASLVAMVTGFLKPDPTDVFQISDGDLSKLKQHLDGLNPAGLALAVRDLARLSETVAGKGGLAAAQKILQVVATMVPKLQVIDKKLDEAKAKDAVKNRNKLMGGSRGGGGGGLPPD